MPVNLSIKNVPDDVAERLRVRAALSHRSLQGELLSILQIAVQSSPDVPTALPAVERGLDMAQAPSALPRTQAWRRGHKAIEQIAQEHRQRFAQPLSAGPMAVDLVRQDRDNR